METFRNKVIEIITKMKSFISSLLGNRKFDIDFNNDSEFPRSIVGLFAILLACITLSVGFNSTIPAGIILLILGFFSWTIEREEK